MKTYTTFTIDTELIQRLRKEPNQSAFINKLLKDYYDHLDNPYANMTADQARVELAILDATDEARRALEKKIEEIRLNG